MLLAILMLKVLLVILKFISKWIAISFNKEVYVLGGSVVKYLTDSLHRIEFYFLYAYTSLQL